VQPHSLDHSDCDSSDKKAQYDESTQRCEDDKEGDRNRILCLPTQYELSSNNNCAGCAKMNATLGVTQSKRKNQPKSVEIEVKLADR
jgi:hypothetical protein